MDMHSCSVARCMARVYRTGMSTAMVMVCLSITVCVNAVAITCSIYHGISVNCVLLFEHEVGVPLYLLYVQND